MIEIWERIHAWFDENAPAGYGNLRAGAGAGDIAMAEKVMGLKFPPDLATSYRVHDGQGNEPGLIGGEGWCLLPLKDTVAFWQKRCEASPRFKECVPLAWGGAGDYIFLDLSSSAKSAGSIIVQRSDSEEPDVVAASFRSWIEEFADKLEGDEFAYSEADDCVMYADEIDLD